MVVKSNFQVITTLMGIWILSLLIVIVATSTDPSNLVMTSSVYMLIISVLLAIFGYVMKLNSKVDVLSERLIFVEGIVDKVTKVVVKGERDE